MSTRKDFIIVALLVVLVSGGFSICQATIFKAKPVVGLSSMEFHRR